MHTPPPPCTAATPATPATPATSSTSPTSTCRWRRGRPVVASAHRPGLVDRRTSAGPPLGSNVQPGLWDPTLALRFAPAVAAERYHTDLRESISSPNVPLQSHSNQVASPALPSSVKAAQSAVAQDKSEAIGAAGPDQEAVSHESNEETVEEPEPEPLSYQIPEHKLIAAIRAAPKTRASYWSSKLYQGPDGEPLSVHYCRSMEVAERVAKKFLTEKVVGFDIEWKPWGSPSSIKQNASLIQLACEDRIALFHIALFKGRTEKELMPPSLKAVLESPDIYKVGVAIKGDFKRLGKYLGVQAQGVFELSRLHNLVQWYEVDPKLVNNKLVGLAAQVHQHLQLPLYKGEPLDDDPATTANVRESDWSLPLDVSQIHYAAADAYAGFRLYDILERKRAHLKPKPCAVLLCDYDSAPKPKLPRKNKKKSGIGKDSSDETSDQNGNTTGVEQDYEKESDDYETAPEDISNSQQSNGPTLTSGLDLSNVAGGIDRYAARRVGRIKIPMLQDPDPAYPSLPRASTSSPESSSPMEAHQCGQTTFQATQASAAQVDLIHVRRATNSHGATSEDEFADADLEEALQGLTLDKSGRLRAMGDSVHENGRHQESGQSQQTMNSHYEDVEDVSDTTSLGSSTSPCEPQVEFRAGQTNRSPVYGSETVAVPPERKIESDDFVVATNWARDYLQATIPQPTATTPSRLRATIPHLRAYYLWHHQRLNVERIARNLREPPLSLSTVQSYILQAITLENLNYEQGTLKELILAMPVSQRKGRWSRLAQKLDALG